MQRLSRLLRPFVGAMTLCATLFFVVSPAEATAPPPAGSLCALIAGLCDAPPAIPPAMRFAVRAEGRTVTVTANTVVQFPVELQAGQANTYTFSYVRFLDNNGVLTAPDACTTFRDNTLSPTIGVEGEVGVATPWARAGSNEVWGASFGPNRITFTDVPRNKLSNVVIGVSCTHLGVTQERSVLLKVRGFDDTNNDPASMTFRALNPPPIDADDPTQSGVGKLHWTLKNDVGACQITEVSRGGDYTPAIRSWGGDDYIKANPGAPLGVTLAVEYPSRPGSSRYTFSMSCSNVAAPIERTIIAARRSSIITGNGNSTGKVLNYGGGTARF